MTVVLKRNLILTSKKPQRKRWEEMQRKTIIYLFFSAMTVLIFSSCHPRQVSDIKANMTKEEVISLWGGTGLITQKVANGKTFETWEYHFSTTDSVCWVTFLQDRVVNTQCRRQPHSYYYPYPYRYYYPYHPYPYRYYYPYYYPYGPY